MNKFLLLYGNCITVRGFARSLICDLQKGRIIFIPNSLFELITDGRYIKIDRVLKELDDKDIMVFQQYLDFIIKQDVGHIVDEFELSCFPKMNDEWLFPARISNCVIDADGTIPYFNEALLNDLSNIGCHNLQMRFFRLVQLEYIEHLLKLIYPTEVKSVEFILPHHKEADSIQKIIDLVNRNKKVQTVIIHSSSEDSIVNEYDTFGFGMIIKSTTKISSAHHCGIIDHKYFSPNISHYTESLAHNTCLNRKISIDVDGNIRNCPSMKESFGNIKDTTLKEAVNKPGFKKYWNITKDEITKCKDCEFRHVCTDCRAYLENPEDMYSAPLKCGYDPYTCEWEEWSTNPLKQQAIEHYGMREIIT
jgi:SPASM domain peptide maturase of grasp-with-spasm system